GDEPVPLVEPAEELALLASVTHEQEEQAIVAVRIDHGDGVPVVRDTQREEFAAAIDSDVDPRRGASTLELHAGADDGETPFESLVHEVSSLAAVSAKGARPAGSALRPPSSGSKVDAAADRLRPVLELCHARLSRTMFSMPLAHPSTLDRQLRRPTWRSFGARRSCVSGKIAR